MKNGCVAPCRSEMHRLVEISLTAPDRMRSSSAFVFDFASSSERAGDGMFGTPLAVYKGMFTGTDPRRIVTLMMSMLLMGCAGATIIPPDLKGQVEKNLSLADVKGSPLSHKGQFMAVGGMVLTVTPTKRDEAKIEILELPLSGGY